MVAARQRYVSESERNQTHLTNVWIFPSEFGPLAWSEAPGSSSMATDPAGIRFS